MPSRHSASTSNLITSFENEIDDNDNQTEIKTESPQIETSVKPNRPPNLTNQTKSTQEKPLQIPKPSYSEILTDWLQNRSVHLQQLFSEFFSTERTQAQNERWRLQHQKSVKGSKIDENKNWNVINWYYNRVKFTLNFRMTFLFWKILKWYLQLQKMYHPTSCKIWVCNSYSIHFSCCNRKTKNSI